MSEKLVKTRIVNKHDLEVNWLKATSFIPKQGELIIYDIEVDANGNVLTVSDGNGGQKPVVPITDSEGTVIRTTPYTYERCKIGDGKTAVTDLPFVTQNAFAKVTIGSTTIEADAKEDTLTLVAGSNITLTPDATNDKITIAVNDHTHDYAASDHNHDGTYAASGHNHDDTYAASSHTHDYAASDHTHTGFAASGHNHNGTYAASSHTHNYAASDHTHTGFASSDHNHDGTYAASSHTHDYAAANHTHTGFAASSHTHGISDITSLQTTLNGKSDSNHGHTYTNDTPIVTQIGSITSGTTFTNVPIQDVLTMILYPFVDITVGTVTPNVAATSYQIPNYPTLTSVTVNVNKNSATNLVFKLWDTTSNRQIGTTLTEANISNNKLTFSGFSVVIDTTRTFKIKYSYKGNGGAASGDKEKAIGTFTLTFKDPSNPTITSNLGASTSYYNGQTASVQTITTNVANLNSAEKITKLELYKGASKVGNTITNPTLPYTFSPNESVTSSTAYKVKAYFNKRSGESTTTSEAYIESDSYSLNFTRKEAEVSLSGIYSETRSKLEPLTISNDTVKANFTKYSDQITSVKLLENSTVKDTQTVTGHSGTTYGTTNGSATFNYSKTNTCTDFKLKAQVYNGDTAGVSSDEVEVSFYAPYCYGYVDESTTFASVNRDVLASLDDDNKSDSMTALVNIASKGYNKFIYAIPNGNYKSAKDSDGNGDENFSLFENSESVESTKKEIEFADGSKVIYQILIFREATSNSTNLYFRN